MHNPRLAVVRPLDRASPLDKPCLFTNVNFLATADEADDNAPIGNAPRELDEVFRLGLAARIAVLGRHVLAVPCALRLVEHQNVFWRDAALVLGILLYIVLDVTHKSLPCASCPA